MLIDTHSHIYLKEFDADRDLVIERALNNSILKILLPNIDSHSVLEILRLSEKYRNICYPMIGLHPTSVKENYEEELSFINNWISKNKFIAIGEIGMDLYWDKTFVEEQKIAFNTQVQLSIKHNLPAVIHIRNAFAETFSVLESINKAKFSGVFHCFSGNLVDAQKAIEMGFLLGIGGVVTYKNASLQEIVKEIPLEKLVLETDSPYLPPVPFRGKRNESGYLIFIAEKIAEIKNISLNKVGEITSENARELFRLL
ncbi:MAG TPA: hydrolase TatD [Bacteroidales bacterium]|nr:MAG: hydrolase TatD [Bacteroidetes bacterium GWF2_33_38]OFY76009.1 MAG: hydrolase TatD [Bacteroidetes bacterium RIFOXYA12_FULL_33_9]OFY90061.1 MAG: hydrolase TatD [Bacteroidetes bacterium RIFOXYA2_FULL_33_7]HBF87648.1 hydrolase TatD [Bacteroidales bacterium]